MENERQSTDDSLPEVSDIVETHNMVDQMTSQVDDSSGSGQTLATQVLLGNMPNDVFVYRQDVVSCRKYEGLLGVVMEVAGDSDSDESITDDSDSEDDVDVTNGGDASKGGDNNNTDGDDDNDSLPDGQVRVVWTDGSETTGNITDITVVDRGFLHGDIVSSAAHPSGQLGLVVDVGITVDLLSANGEVIKNVTSKDLKRIREFTVGDYVVKGPWLGRVDDVLDNVTVLFDDGSICKVVKADPLRLQPVSKPVIDDSGCPYYPGQRIRAVSSSVFKSSRWLSGLWKANRLEGTVINVQTASVVVYWIASAYVSVDTNSSTVPSEEQNPKDLTLLDCFSYSNWQLGDWCLLPSSNADGTLKGSKHKEPVNGIGENTDTNMNSCSESSVQCFHGTDLVNTGTQISEELNTLANVMDIEGVEYDSHDQQLASCANIDDCSGDWDSTPRESKSTDPMELDEGNVAVPNLILLKDASSSIPSSVSKEAAANEYWPSYRRKLRKVLFKRDKKGRRRDETFERALFIINTVTKVDVAWQNGTKEYGLDSTSLIPVQTPNDHDFFPEQYVVEKSADEGEDTSETKHTGIVRTLNAKDKTVCVRWFKPVARPEDAWEFDYDEVVSAYQLDGHPDYDYCYGDVVVRLSPVLYTANTSDIEGATGHKEGNLSDMQSNDDRGHQLPSDEACEDFTSLSWVGNITGLRDGDIEVTWADGMVSKVGPQAIYVVGRDDDGDSFGGGSEASNDGASWETVDENDMNTLKTVENVDSLNEDTELSSSTDVHPGSPPQNSNLGRNGPLSMPLAALGYVTRLASGFFSRGKKESDSECSSEIGNALRENHVASELNHVTSDALDGQNHTKKVPETAETDDTETTEDIDMSTPVGRIGDSIVEESLDGFKHFDITENPLDHYFLGSSGGQGLGGRKWVKKVQQEWSILEKNLPDAIFVRVFEDRMDLLRAVIIGAPGTPYQDGLFFFDFHLLPEYPVVPPSVYYHSGGLRVNPNLYVDGKVCLSLLNTWTGKGNEVWDPSSSSILQVLVSLQGLVLNSKPYFNEAGYDKQVGTIEGEKNSLPYNENTYLLNLKSMMYLLRRPPMFFEGFIRDHFRQRGHYILKACAAYMGGCTIGSLTKDACLTEKSNEYPCSVGFKLMLAKILPRLITALTEVGVDCHQFEHSQASNNLPTA